MTRRIKTFHLSAQQVAQGFDHSGPPHVSVDMPEGYRVESVDLDHETKTFRFVVSHESFPEVPEGEAPEELQANLVILA